jgi:hypothetical protein
MAKKITTTKTTAASKSAAVPTTTAIRNSAVPPKAAAAKKQAPAYDQIALSAYLIWKSGTGGNQDDNWLRAERELRGL